jgi:hypothetical protein
MEIEDLAVYFFDLSDQKINDMIDFCDSAGLKLIKYSATGISGYSGNDYLSEFHFADQEDIMIFKLKYL